MSIIQIISQSGCFQLSSNRRHATPTDVTVSVYEVEEDAGLLLLWSDSEKNEFYKSEKETKKSPHQAASISVPVWEHLDNEITPPLLQELCPSFA